MNRIVVSVFDAYELLRAGNLEAGREYVVINKKNLAIVARFTALPIDKTYSADVLFEYQQQRLEELKREIEGGQIG